MSLSIPLAALIATIAAARSLPRWQTLHRFEHRLFEIARRFHTERKIALFADISALGSSTLITAIAALGGAGLLLGGRTRDGVVLAAVCALSGASGTWLKRITRRERPHDPTGATFGSSFPSSHTLMATACWLTIGGLASEATAGALQAWIGATAALIAAAVGLSRVFLRVHYLSDVLAGWAVGAAWCAAGLIWRGAWA